MNKNKFYYYLGFALLVILLNFAITNFNGFSDSFSYLYNIIKPVIIGSVIAYFVYPLVKIINKRIFFINRYPNLGYYVSIILAYLLIFLILYLLGYFLKPIIIDSIEKITKLDYHSLKNNLNNSWLEFQNQHEIFKNINIIDIINRIYHSFTNFISNFDINSFLKTFLGFTSSIYAYIMGIILSIYIIIYKEDLFISTDKFFSVVCKENHYPIIKKYFLLFEETFKKFFFGKMLDSLIIGILAFIGLAILKIPFYPLLALIIMVTNMIPYFGPLIGGIPTVIVTLFVTGSPTHALVSGIFVLLLQQFDGIYLGPKILGDSVGIKSVWVLIAIIIGGALFKVIGLLLCVPFAATFKKAFDEFYEYRIKQRKKRVKKS